LNECIIYWYYKLAGDDYNLAISYVERRGYCAILVDLWGEPFPGYHVNSFYYCYQMTVAQPMHSTDAARSIAQFWKGFYFNAEGRYAAALTESVKTDFMPVMLDFMSNGTDSGWNCLGWADCDEEGHNYHCHSALIWSPGTGQVTGFGWHFSLWGGPDFGPNYWAYQPDFAMGGPNVEVNLPQLDDIVILLTDLLHSDTDLAVNGGTAIYSVRNKEVTEP
jgi:hypothetical protein